MLCQELLGERGSGAGMVGQGGEEFRAVEHYKCLVSFDQCRIQVGRLGL